MRASTANKILLWIVVAVGVAALLELIKGDPEGRELFGGFVFVAVLLGGFWYLGNRYRVAPRRADFEGQAEEVGLHAEPGDPLGLLDVPFTLFGRTASVRDIENTATGVRGGERVVVADYWYAPSSDPQLDDYQRYTCVLSEAPAWWPGLSVFPEGLAARLRSTFALPDIRMESEEFNRRFEVRSSDRRFANAFLDARMMQWLLEQPSMVGFEVLAGRLMVFRRRVTTSVDDVSRAIELHEALADRIPRAVRTGPL